MDERQLDLLLEQAAERGARRALERLGLHDDDAGKDIRDLRTLIDGWRDAKRTVSKAIIQWATIGVLGLLTIGTLMQLTGAKK
jgi:hypothetical protein